MKTYRDWIEVMTPTSAPDGAGGRVVTPGAWVGYFAHVRPLTSSRVTEANQTELKPVLEITVREECPIEMNSVVRFNGREYAPVSVIDSNTVPPRRVATVRET